MIKELIPESLLDALKAYSPTLVQASRTILAEGITKYPIFIASQDFFKVGIPLIDGKEYGKIWNINVSSLEEFYTKKIMNQTAVDQFRKVYKDPKKFFCIFLVRKEEVKMLYIPIEKQFIHQK